MENQTVVQTLTKNDAYSIRLGGTADETNCGYPVCGYGYPHPELRAQPNIMVRIENTGDNDLVNPRLIVNGRRRMYDLETFAADLVADCDTTAERSKAFFWWFIHQRIHSNNRSPENSQALIFANTLGYMICGNNVHVMYQLWRRACMPGKRGFHKLGAEPSDGAWRGTDLGAHYTAEYFYDGRWRVLDGNVAVYYLLRDNKTIAARKHLHADHDLIRRAHYGTLTNRPDALGMEKITGLYRRDLLGMHPAMQKVQETWDLTLRAGESIEYRWDHRGLNDLGYPLDRKILDLVTGNGYWRYRPDLRGDAARKAVWQSTNLRWPDSADRGLTARLRDRPFSATWKFHCPYYFLGGRVRLKLAGGPEAKVTVLCRFKRAHKGWQEAGLTVGGGAKEISLDRFFVKDLHCHDIDLRLVGENGAEVLALEFEADIQLALRSLPMLTVGDNRIEYFDSTGGAKSVRITHEFRPVDRGPAPHPPTGPTYPPDGGDSDGLTFDFTWPDAEGDGKIRDYHFQLSDDPKLRWRLSTNFDRLTRLSAPKGRVNAYRIPHDGLLNPDSTYYWRVRAMNDRGLWSDWSRTWSFTARGPGIVTNFKARVDEKTGDLVLAWSDARGGTRPAGYEIHGSDERGFTAADKPVKRLKRWVIHHNLVSGEPKVVEEPVWMELPATRLGTTTKVEYRVPAGGRWYAFWRVVAIDEAGNRSGASDCVCPPRPYIHAPGELRAPGRDVDLPVPHVRSAGHLVHEQTPNTNLYLIGEGDELRFTKLRGPKWLKVDPAAGRLSGTAPKAGEYVVEVKVTDQNKQTHSRAFKLIVGSQKS